MLLWIFILGGLYGLVHLNAKKSRRIRNGRRNNGYTSNYIRKKKELHEDIHQDR